MIYIILLVVILLAVYAAAENLYILTVRREKLGSGIKIAHLSDLHKRSFGRGNSRLISRVRAEKPDLIIFSGDLVSRDITDLKCVEKTLGELCKIAPVYTIYGNHEQSISAEMKPGLEAMFARSEAVLLKNHHTTVSIKGRELKIYGLLENYGVYKKNGGYRGLDSITADDLEASLEAVPRERCCSWRTIPFSGKPTRNGAQIIPSAVMFTAVS